MVTEEADDCTLFKLYLLLIHRMSSGKSDISAVVVLTVNIQPGLVKESRYWDFRNTVLTIEVDSVFFFTFVQFLASQDISQSSSEMNLSHFHWISMLSETVATDDWSAHDDSQLSRGQEPFPHVTPEP